jgi:hypothetical protein
LLLPANWPLTSTGNEFTLAELYNYAQAGQMVLKVGGKLIQIDKFSGYNGAPFAASVTYAGSSTIRSEMWLIRKLRRRIELEPTY